MVRLDRLTAILVQLHARRTLRAQDLAREYGTSLRTIYRDIRTLTDAGVPIEGEAGAGYRLMDGYRLPPVMFSREEALACLTAGKFMQRAADPGMGSAYNAALAKIRAVLPGDDRDSLEAIEQRIAVWPHLRPQPLAEPVPRNLLQPVLASLSSRKALAIGYHKPDAPQPEPRTVEPVGVYFQGGHWYLAAWCRLRQDYREFRLDRIASLQPTPSPFTRRHPPLQTYLDERHRTEAHPLIPVALRVNGETRYLDSLRQALGFVAQETAADHLILHFQAYTLEGFARWLMQYADHVQVLDPPQLRQHLHQLLADALRMADRPTGHPATETTSLLT